MICLIFKTFESHFNLAEARVTRCTDFFPKLIHSDLLLRCWGQGDRVGECGYQHSILFSESSDIGSDGKFKKK